MHFSMKMKTISSKIFKVLVLTTTFQFFASVSSASILGFNLPFPKNAIQIKFAPISQFQDRFTHRLTQGFNSSFMNPPAFTDNRRLNNSNANANSFNPTLDNNQQVYPSAPQQKPDCNNNVTPRKTQNNANYNQQSNKDNTDSYDSIEDSKPMSPATSYQFNTGHNNLINDNASDWMETDLTTTDTTISDDEWTTTEEPLNRIGAPPAIVASLLG